MAAEVVGRNEELALVRAFAGRACERPSALVLEGEAGIGKSTLWLAGVEAAREGNLRVLVSRPAEAERSLAFAGLGDLFEEVLAEVLPALTPPQRRAMEIALLVREAEGEAVDPRALGLAIRSVLGLLAGDTATVLAVDDIQWLDASSAASLVYALRRLPRSDVRLLLARRTGETTLAPDLASAVDATDVERMSVGPLSLGAIHRLLLTRLERPLRRPTLLRVHEASGGNPFYALELVRAVDATASADPTQPLPVPEPLESLVGARLGALPAATRSALLLAAAAERPSRAHLQSAGVRLEALEPALDADVIRISGDSVRFSHPLLASVLLQQATDNERRRTHAALADVAGDDVARARHLALASAGPDDGLAAVVEDAAATARARGAAAEAAELGELAVLSTPPQDVDARRRRLLRAGKDHLVAGAKDRAVELAQRVLEHAEPGAPRAEAFTLLGEIETFRSPAAAVPHLNAALAEGPLAPELAFVVHENLAWCLRGTDSLSAAEPHVRAASELATSLDAPALVARALALEAEIHLGLGRPDAFAIAERAVALARSAHERTAFNYALEALGHCFFFGGRLAEGRDVLLELARWGAQHDETAVETAVWYLGMLEYRAGRWDRAREYAERLVAILGTDSPSVLLTPALVSAAVGDEASARALAERALAWNETYQMTFLQWFFRSILAMLDHWSGDSARASEQFAAIAAEEAAEGGRSVLKWIFGADEIESLLALGRTDDGLAVLEPWEAEARSMDLAWPLAEATRCRGLIAAACGNVEEAIALLERAAAEHDAVGDPFGRARAQLALGVVRRRARQKRAARDAIEAAIAGFEQLGAAAWAEKARAELGRLGGRRRSEGLTPAESRVAALVAEGRTNREVAAALFLGERTVESHLSHVYAKLGVRSRTELARALRTAP